MGLGIETFDSKVGLVQVRDTSGTVHVFRIGADPTILTCLKELLEDPSTVKAGTIFLYKIKLVLPTFSANELKINKQKVLTSSKQFGHTVLMVTNQRVCDFLNFSAW